MNITWYSEDREIREWISDIRRELLFENYKNRGRLQKQLLVLERAKKNLYNARQGF